MTKRINEGGMVRASGSPEKQLWVVELGNTGGVPGRLGSGGLRCEAKWGYWRTR